MKLWLQETDVEIYSTNNEGKFAVAERFIRNLNNKSYKYMTSISKIAQNDKLAHIFNDYNNTYHNTIKIKRADVKSVTYIDFSKGNKDKDL